jgi:hypothetical protein
VAADPDAGQGADQDVGRQPEVDVPRDDVGEPGGPEQDRRVEDVPTTRVGTSRNSRISPTAINAPLPAEVTPSTKPTQTPSATAAILWRRS